MMSENGLRLLSAVLIAACIKSGVALAGHSIHWVYAVLIALAVVYGGWLILTGDVID